MKIEMKYSGGIINLPSKVADAAPIADETQLRVLLTITAEPKCFTDFDLFLPVLCDRLEITPDEVKSALSFWAKQGVLSVDGIDDAVTQATEIMGIKDNKEPTYTGKQILSFMEKNKEFKALCNECQTVMGKSFTAHDYNNIMKLKDYFKFSDEYILLLLEHCVEADKANWTYIRKTATYLYDEGITSYTKLENHFAARRNKNSLEYKLRKLLGIGEREFTKTERGFVEKWVMLKISFDVISKAYEITVENCQGKFSYAYMSKVLDNWHSHGLKTLEDVEKSLENYKNKQKMSMSSFDADDFFEAALERSNKKMMERRNK